VAVSCGPGGHACGYKRQAQHGPVAPPGIGVHELDPEKNSIYEVDRIYHEITAISSESVQRTAEALFWAEMRN
jgi:hypothetical protein